MPMNLAVVGFLSPLVLAGGGACEISAGVCDESTVPVRQRARTAVAMVPRACTTTATRRPKKCSTEQASRSAYRIVLACETSMRWRSDTLPQSVWDILSMLQLVIQRYTSRDVGLRR